MSSSQQLLLGEGAGGGGYQIERSLRFNSADSAYLNRTPASASNRKTFTFSCWFKFSASIGSGNRFFSARTDDNNRTNLGIDGNGYPVFINHISGTASSSTCNDIIRDVGAWYHFVFAIDTTQATDTNRIKIYKNGVQMSFSSATYPAQNADTQLNNNVVHGVGRTEFSTPSGYCNGYLTEINFIDGQALTPSDFGETDTNTGVWKPKAYSGTYGTNGFYLKFTDNSNTTAATLGKDSSGNGNNWTPNNFSVTAGAGNDSLVDTPTNYGTDTGVGGEVRGNYCTWNPLFNNQTGISSSNTGTVTITNGNLTVAPTSSSIAGTVGTIGVSSGKWYFEYTVEAASPSGDVAGFITSFSGANTTWIGYRTTGVIYNNGSSTSGYATATAGDIIGIALDIGGSTISCYKNNTLLATTALNTAITADCFPLIWFRNDTGSGSVNFGQRAFAYTAPSGFKALCTQNLPTPTIGATSTTQANDYFNVLTYTGNGTDGRTVTGVGFNPDLVWVKGRSNTGANVLADAVRGSDKNLYTNLTDAETNPITGASGGGVGTVTTDGFVLEQGTVNMDLVNTNARTYVAWNWKANGAGSTNTAGTITSTVSANTTSGFSIVTYTGTLSTGTNPSPTVGHGLGVAPSLIISKSRNVSAPDGGAWHVNHVYNYNNYLRLNTTAAGASISGNGGGTPANPTSTVFSAYYLSGSGITGNNYVAYCFAPVAGYSAFGSFTGNGSTDGPFVFTNHRPAFLLVKRTDTTSNWTILDFQREGYNVDNDPLYPNLSDAEGTADLADILSNGFKLRSTDASVNASGGTYIYMSLASNPFKYSLAR